MCLCVSVFVQWDRVSVCACMRVSVCPIGVCVGGCVYVFKIVNMCFDGWSYTLTEQEVGSLYTSTSISL